MKCRIAAVTAIAAAVGLTACGSQSSYYDMRSLDTSFLYQARHMSVLTDSAGDDFLATSVRCSRTGHAAAFCVTADALGTKYGFDVSIKDGGARYTANGPDTAPSQPQRVSSTATVTTTVATTGTPATPRLNCAAHGYAGNLVGTDVCQYVFDSVVVSGPAGAYLTGYYLEPLPPCPTVTHDAHWSDGTQTQYSVPSYDEQTGQC